MVLLTNIPSFQVKLYKPFLFVALLLVERCRMKDVFLQAASVTKFVCGCSFQGCFLGVPVKHTLNFPDLHSHEKKQQPESKTFGLCQVLLPRMEQKQRFEKRN